MLNNIIKIIILYKSDTHSLTKVFETLITGAKIKILL